MGCNRILDIYKAIHSWKLNMYLLLHRSEYTEVQCFLKIKFGIHSRQVMKQHRKDLFFLSYEAILQSFYCNFITLFLTSVSK